jgi:hypothetical protein
MEKQENYQIFPHMRCRESGSSTGLISTHHIKYYGKAGKLSDISPHVECGRFSLIDFLRINLDYITLNTNGEAC